MVRGFVAAFLMAVLPGAATAAPELITNGNFDTWSLNGGASTQSAIVAGGQTSGTNGATLSGWVNTGYSFVFSAGTASSTGALTNPALGSLLSPRLALWGPEGGILSPNYSNNGLTGAPTGGAFLASDGDYQPGRIYQTITGLSVGQSYNLSFWWAGAQQSGYSNATTEGWNVYWGTVSNYAAQAYATATANTPSRGFTPWTQASYQLVATQGTMVLSFLATGGPNGTPPFSLIDGVSLQASSPVPEPASVLLMVTGIGAIGLHGFARRRAKQMAFTGS